MEQEKVKVVLVADLQANKREPKTRFVTKEAAGYLKPKWQLAEDQSGIPAQTPKKNEVVAPVDDKKAKLQEEYKQISGADPDPVWNEARLFVELNKAKRKSAEQSTQPSPTNTEKPKRKYTKRQPINA